MILEPPGDVEPVADIYWINHAGGTTGTLANRMRALKAMPLRVQTPTMPMREDLVGTSSECNLVTIASLLADQIQADQESLSRPRPAIVIGHSFGSILAYRTTCCLTDRGQSPHRLVVMSFPAPDRVTYRQQLHSLDDLSLVKEVDELFGGIPNDIRDDPDALQYFVPALRFDLGLLEGYQHDDHAKLPVSMVAICGTDDRAVDLAGMNRWEQFGSSQFRLRSMPGDHFFPLERVAEVLDLASWDAKQ